MGLLGAIGAGLGEGLQAGATMLQDEIKAESAFQRNMQMLTQKMKMESEQRRSDKMWEMGQQDARKAADNTKVDAAMTGLINKKFAASDAGIAGAAQPMSQAQLDSIQMAKDADRFDPSMRAQALASSGVLDQKDSVGLLSGVEEKSYKRGRDLEDDARKDQDFALREKELQLREREAGKGAELRKVQLDMATLQYNRAVEENKVPAAVMKSFDAKQARSVPMLKIEPSSGFDPTSETGKRVIEEQATLAKDMNKMLEPYQPKGKSSGIDLNKFMPGNNPAPSPAPAPGKPGAPAPAPSAASQPATRQKTTAEINEEMRRVVAEKLTAQDSPTGAINAQVGKFLGL
jgi:hypothetical protein